MSKYAELFDAEVNTQGLAPEGEEPSKYAELFDSEVNLQQEQARTMIETALKDDPEIAAERVRLSETSGVPLDVVQRNLEELRVKERARAVDLVNMAQESPILYRQLTDPAFVTTAIDDLDTLKNLEKAFTRSIDYITDTDKGLVEDAAGAGRSLGLGATVGLGAGLYDLAGVVNDLIGWQAGAEGARQQATRARESMAYFGLQGESSTAQGVRSGLESAGQNLALMPLGLARNVWATANQAAAAVAGAMSTFVGAEAYNRAREQGRNKLEAAAFAIPQAGFEYVFEKIPASKLFGDIAADEKFLRMLGKQVVTEGWTEQVTTLAQDFNEWMNLNPKKTLAEFLAERPEAAYQTFVATLVGVGVQTSTIKGVDAIITRATDRQLRFEQDILQQQMELARDSALRARSPEMFRQHIERVQNSDEGAKKEIYVDAEALNQLPPELLNQLPEAVRQQIPEALAANSTVAVPMADVLTVAPGSDLETFLNDNARVRPNARTRAEAQLTEQLVAEEADRVLQQAADQATWSQSADTVRTRVLEQLNTAGRWSPEVNEAYATLQANFFSSMAARAGLTPEQLFDRYQLKVQARMPGASEQALNAIRWDMRLAERDIPPVVRDPGQSIFKPHTLEDRKAGYRITFKNPIQLSDGTRLSGFTKYDQSVFYGYDKNGEAFTLRREFLDPALIESSRDDNRTADAVRAGIQQLVDNNQLDTQSAPYLEPDQLNQTAAPTETLQGDPVEPSDDVAAIEQGVIPEDVDAGATLENALQIAKSKVWQKGRDLKVAMQEAVQSLARAAGVDVGTPSPQTTDYLVRVGVKDALQALQQNANAIGWYDLKTRQALAVMSLVHPEIATDEDARLAFVWAMAVTSNGLKVDKNFELAERVYAEWKASAKKVADRRMPTNVGIGTAKNAINDSLELFNDLHDAWGLENLRKFMQTNFTVGEITAIAKDLKPGGEHADVTVRGAAILGPKIGNGFFSNLYGNFSALTMDRWLIRTWGRWSGTLIRPMPVQTAKARERLSASLAAIVADEAERARLSTVISKPITAEMSVDELAIAVQEASVDPDVREQLNQSDVGLELRKAGNSLAKYLDGQKEAPAGPGERKYIREVFGRMLDELRQDPRYADLTMADLQAVLWYAEKRLYETAKQDLTADANIEGYEDDEAPDYANAAASVARQAGVSERRITNALKKEADRGRPTDARPGDGTEGAQPQGQQAAPGGFTRQEKRFFIGSRAILRIRSYTDGDGQPSRPYRRASDKGRGKPRVLKALKVRYVAEWNPRKFATNIFKANDLARPSFVELAQNDTENAQRFADAITASKQASGAIGAAVYVYPVEEYTGMRLFLSEDGNAGFALKPDGDIVSVFSAPGSNAGRAVMELAVTAGGKKLDAFDTILPEFYSAHGFVAVARLTWDDAQAPEGWDKAALARYNNGQPDVVFMVYDPTYTGGYSALDGKRYEGENAYTDAVAAQTKAMARVARQERQRARQAAAAAPADALAQTARLTPEQLTWAEGTEVVDETGQPQVMYTGTAADIIEFRPGQAGAIYVSPNPAFASGFAESAARRADGEGAANVVPVIVRATNIFDPANPDHREGLRAWLTDRYGEDGVVVIEAPRVPPMRLTPAQLAERIASGNWMYVESPVVQEYIRAAGHDGFWTVERKTRNLGVFEPNQLKSVFNRAPTGAPGILNQPGQQPLGTFNPEEMLITLGESANLSTFLHESGHYFLEVLADIAADPATPQEIRDDWATAMAWGGFTQAQWDQWQAEYQATKKIPAGMRDFHERWAESFEAYLFEGKAPSAELQPLFRRFRSWLLNVYQSLWRFLQNRNLQMNAEIRAVFDRMLATDEQIRQAEEAAGLLPDFNATNEAIEQLQARSLRDLRWTINARGRELKKLEKEAKNLRKGVEAEVRAEVERQPIYRAMTWLKKGEMVDEATGDLIKADKGFRLDTAALKEMYPESMLARPDTAKLKGMTGKDGLHPDLVAEMFGFETGDALVRAIINAEPIQSVVDGITDQRMLERHGDLATPEAREEAANEAVHNEARARALATELKAQSDMLRERQATGRTDARGRPITVNALVQAAKDFGATIAARRPVRELKNAAWQHRAAEARAGKRWDEATRKGQTEAAVQAKRDQMLNNAAAKALQEAQAEVREIIAFFRRVVKDNNEKIVKKGRDPDVVNAMRAILAAYGVAPRLGKSALEYMEAVKRNDPAMYNALAPSVQTALVNAMPLQELTMEELRGLNDELRAMWDLAKRSRQMEIDGNLMDLEDLEQELMDRMQKIGIPSSIPGEKGAITDREERSIKLQFAKAILSRVEQWAERLDGKYGGPFLRLVFRPVKEAADRYRAARVDYRQRFTAMLEAVAPMLPPGPIAAPELGYTFGNARDSGVAELLHAILHTGNQSNKRKLLLGRGWATENPDGSLNTGPLPDGRQGWDAFVQRMHDEGKLQKAHYDFAQGVWDLLEEMKPLAQKTHREVYGRYFAEVTADELVTPFGTYRGGYVPAQTDSRLVKDAKLRELAEGENESMAYAFPAAPSGFTKARVEYNKPLMLDLRVLAQHMDKVLLFSHMQGPINDVRRLLTRKQVSTALDRIDPAAYEGMLIPWLNRSARQIVETPVAGDRRLSRFLSAMRNRAGMALMFANLSNAAQQITGFSMAGIKVKPGLMLEAAAAFIRNPKNMQRTVAELSPYMKDRMLNEVSALNDAVERILVNPTWLERSQEWTQQHAYFLQTAVDRTMSPIIWTAAYNQAIGEKMSERDAARFADGVIRQTQGSTLPEDVSRFETGPAYGRLFTQFVGYFNMMANTNATAVSQIAGEMGLRKGAGRLLYVALAGLLVPIWVAEAIAHAFRGGPDDEDEDGYLDDWLAAVFGLGTVRGLLAQVPVVGQFAQIAVNRVNDNPADDKFSLSPAVSLLESAAGAPVSVYKAVIEDGNAQKALRDTAAAATLLTGLPIFGVVRPIGYTAGVVQGKIEPTGPIDLTRGLVTGTAAPESRVP